MKHRINKMTLIGITTFFFIAAGLLLFGEQIVKPHTFVDGDIISASEMNENFDAIYVKANELDTRVGDLEAIGPSEGPWTGDENIAYYMGNVGIGTMYPQSRLHIDGSSAGTFNRVLKLANYDITPNNTTVLDFWAASGGGTQSKSFVSLVAEFPNHTFASDEGVFHVYTRNGHDHEPRLTVNSTGNVGIGTTVPSDKLSIGERVLISDSINPANPPAGGVVIYFDRNQLWAKNSFGITSQITSF